MRACPSAARHKAACFQCRQREVMTAMSAEEQRVVEAAAARADALANTDAAQLLELLHAEFH